ncbi:hypothetical protein RF11_07919 [Thelohanellus kitauei]|uniref:Tc1-like transposase DDE domain-containing protein n=1 Tax=Thelohanellus kitauei TaxID=669202 RepID=A0A0C2ID19_THEKT|nr:hypothetical protein RF11_07919 [Thelohanellus kitauei]
MQHRRDDFSLTLEQLSGRFFSATNIRISKNTVARYLKEYNYSFKKIKFILERRNIASTIQERHDYVIKYLEYSSSNRFILFINETGFNVSMRRNYVRAICGNPTEKIKNIKSEKITVCSAISRNSNMFYKVSERAFNNDLYTDLPSNLMNIIYEKQLKNVMFIMDVPFHKGASIKCLITAWGHEVFYLPPNSPFLNPIENIFSQ